MFLKKIKFSLLLSAIAITIVIITASQEVIARSDLSFILKGSHSHPPLMREQLIGVLSPN